METITITVSKGTYVALANMCIDEMAEIGKLEEELTKRGIDPRRSNPFLCGPYREELRGLIKQFSEAAGE